MLGNNIKMRARRHRKLDISCARWRLQSDFPSCPFEHNFPFALCTAIRRDTSSRSLSLSHTTASRVPVTRGHQAALCVVDLRRERARARIHVSGALQLIGQNNWFFLHTAARARERESERSNEGSLNMWHAHAYKSQRRNKFHYFFSNLRTSSSPMKNYLPTWSLVAVTPDELRRPSPIYLFQRKKVRIWIVLTGRREKPERLFAVELLEEWDRTWMKIGNSSKITFYRSEEPHFFKDAV
jgi:hypothetical protein